MQKVLLIGYLGRDPEVKYSTQGTAITQFSVATTERWKDKSGELQEHTEWFAIKAFGRRAEIIGDYLHKGSRVYIEGRKRTESWDDKQTGGKHFRDLVYVDKLEFLDSKSKNGNGNGQRQPAEIAEEAPTRTAISRFKLGSCQWRPLLATGPEGRAHPVDPTKHFSTHPSRRGFVPCPTTALPRSPRGWISESFSPSLKFHSPQIRFFGVSPTLRTTGGAGKSCLMPIRAPTLTA